MGEILEGAEYIRSVLLKLFECGAADGLGNFEISLVFFDQQKECTVGSEVAFFRNTVENFTVLQDILIRVIVPDLKTVVWFESKGLMNLKV
jgi:hypothetical protein